LFHCPAFIDAVACGMWRASETISEIACSAVVMVLPPGVFITTMPRLVAAPTSTLSTPMPARPITFNCLAASITSLVTFVPLRITNASASAIASANSPGDSPGEFTTSTPSASSRISRPWVARESVTRTFATIALSIWASSPCFQIEPRLSMSGDGPLHLRARGLLFRPLRSANRPAPARGLPGSNAAHSHRFPTRYVTPWMGYENARRPRIVTEPTRGVNGAGGEATLAAGVR